MSGQRFMAYALALGRRHRGQTGANPSVGCVIVKDGKIVGRAVTALGGRPHAETQALAQAGAAARGATAYVTLEPCAHTGKTGPCAEALIHAGIRRVVAAMGDPYPKVAGQGFAMLCEAGIEVEVGLLADAAREGLAGFLSRIEKGRPLVTLKVASSLDGRIAAPGGDSKWITGPWARSVGHKMRARADAILVGAETALTDNPDLTCRLPGLEQASPIRIVADGRLRLPLTSKLVATARQVPTWVLTGPMADPLRRQALEQAGVTVLDLPAAADGGLDLTAAAQLLGQRGINDLLVEGGGRLLAAFLRAGLADRLHWFRAPMLLGGDGIPALGALGLTRVSHAPRLCLLSRRALGDDVLETYAIQP